VKSKSELYSCQKRGKAPVTRQIYKVAIRLRLRFWCLYLQLSFVWSNGLSGILTALWRHRDARNSEA